MIKIEGRSLTRVALLPPFRDASFPARPLRPPPVAIAVLSPLAFVRLRLAYEQIAVPVPLPDKSKTDRRQVYRERARDVPGRNGYPGADLSSRSWREWAAEWHRTATNPLTHYNQDRTSSIPRLRSADKTRTCPAIPQSG